MLRICIVNFSHNMQIILYARNYLAIAEITFRFIVYGYG